MTVTNADSLEKRRKKTNKSLHSERANTDASLALKSGKSERSASDGQSAERAATDEALVKRRTKTDESNLAARGKGLSKGHASHDEVHAETQARLREERMATDAILERERTRTDALIAVERGEKDDAAQAFLESERGATDQDLASERQRTDQDVAQSGKELEKELVAHGATRAALTSRDEFLAIVSHDLRNPLSSIYMVTELLALKCEKIGFGEKEREYVELIKRNAEASLRLIDDLLDMERLALGKLLFTFSVADVTDIARQSCRTLAHIAAAKGVALHFDNGTQRVAVQCDSGRIQQALSNVIGNAIKFTPPGGEVTVSLGQVGSDVAITVKDTGLGIPIEKRKTIFEKFSQLEDRGRSGLGLGLYVSKMIMEAHGGSIRVDSKEGVGSTFTVKLPCGYGGEA